MKIVVNNEEEKKLVSKFIEYLSDCGFDEMETQDNKWANEYNDGEPMLWGQEWTLLRDSFNSHYIISVDPNEEEMYFEDDDIITGTCKHCGKRTIGTIDNEAITYSEYLRIMSEENQKDWYCDTCWLNGVYEKEEPEPRLFEFVTFNKNKFTVEPFYANMMNEVIRKVDEQTDDLLTQWIKANVQDKFDKNILLGDKETFFKTLRENGYTLRQSGFNEYVLYQHNIEIARVEVPIVFNK